MTARTRIEQRLARLRGSMARAGVGLTAIAPTDNLRWLLGFAPLYDERACALIVSAERAVMLMPGLNAEQTAAHAPEIPLVRWADEDGPVDALRDALARVAPGATAAELTFAADPQMRADHLLLLQGALPGVRTIDAGEVLWPLREIKDGSELAALARAAGIADRAMEAAWTACAAGVSELSIAEAINNVFAAYGCEPEFALVGAGAHSAFPHHETGGQLLAEGDAVVIDLGGVLEGYHSDITRMAFIGEPTARYREVHSAVEAAVAAALEATRPGATCGEIDAAARDVISAAGFAEFFVHRTGHGLGLSGHEPPYVMAGSDVVLRPGMVHSIEPGIYLPGEFGVRLEEIVHVTEDGCERFSGLGRHVHIS
ncbi:MAG TPA: Xaa-Pro peptidase family protein [Solirubrobacteraceae bacterium]|nr:Xaa-Pro peptidase family protein [Solirubrobacteraceae bacterium]